LELGKAEQKLAMADMMQRCGLPDIIAVMVNISLLQLNSGLTINNLANWIEEPCLVDSLGDIQFDYLRVQRKFGHHATQRR